MQLTLLCDSICCNTIFPIPDKHINYNITFFSYSNSLLTGIKNAKVLPLPVLAAPNMSSPRKL